MKILFMLVMIILMLVDVILYISLKKWSNKHKQDLLEEHWKYIKTRLIAILVISNILLILGVGMTAACGKTQYPDLPNDGIAFYMGKFTDMEDDDAAYGTIEYESRTYMPYGTLKNTI